MAILTREHLHKALSEQPLFEDKSWRLSPQPWPLSEAQLEEIRAIGSACLEFHNALETLYRRSVEGANLLRNRSLTAPWVARYLDRGKPDRLIAHARNPVFKGAVPAVIRPDLLLTEDGFALTEMDSVPGGIGLTAFLNQLYYPADDSLVGGRTGMAESFARTLAAAAAETENPLIAVIVSDEAATYRPEFEYLAGVLRNLGWRIHVRHPDEIMPLGNTLCIPVDGEPLKVDVIYRFWELFDIQNISTFELILAAVEHGDVKITPPMKPYQEEKLNLALFHHHILEDFWRENLSRKSLRILHRVVPKSWVLDPVELPPNAVLDAPPVGGKPIRRWDELADASQKERSLIIKASGFHESAWGARSVTLGSDSSRQDWRLAIEQAVGMADHTLHVLQEYRKPKRIKHPVFSEDGRVVPMEGRTRLCPYYFVSGDQVELAGILATFCPADKKIIHGMRDGAMLPCALDGKG